MCCILDCSFVFLTLYSWSFNNMTHNSIQHHDALCKLQVYVASPLFLHSIGWSQAEIGHIVSDKLTQATLVAIAVSRVNEHKFTCSPDGNFNAKFNKPEKVKFSFMLECPSDPAYSDDWDRLLGGLDKTQSAIAFMKDKQNLIEGATKSIQFAVPIFEKRVCFAAFPFCPPKGVFFFKKEIKCEDNSDDCM